jgi:hypothetical protein
MKLTCFEEEMKERMLICGHPSSFPVRREKKWVSSIFVCYFRPAEGKLMATVGYRRPKEGIMIDDKEMRHQMERLSNAELISILLRRDGKEWQPEILEIVGEILSKRGTSPGKGVKCTAAARSTLEETEGMNLKTVAEYVSHLDAEEDRMILENEGVQAWIFVEDGIPAEGIPPSVQLKVSAEDWEVAMIRLNAEDMDSHEPSA